MKPKRAPLYGILVAIFLALYVLSVGPIFGGYVLSRSLRWVGFTDVRTGRLPKDARPLTLTWDEYSGDFRSEMSEAEVSRRRNVYKLYTPLWWLCERSPAVEETLESYILHFGRKGEVP